MAADILQIGKCDIEGYADDGKTVLIINIAFGLDHKVTPTTTWDKAGATIYSDIRTLRTHPGRRRYRPDHDDLWEKHRRLFAEQ